MSYWLREIVGWGLVLAGIAVFGLVIACLLNGQVYQTASMTVIGIFIFRGGIHLLKVAVAARVCDEAAAQLRQPPPLVRTGRGKYSA